MNCQRTTRRHAFTLVELPAVSKGKRRAFTLVELLIVIGLITVLIGILLPVISKMRDQAYAASCRAQIQSLSATIDAYFGDFNAYPGPLSYQQVYSSQGAGSIPPVIGPAAVMTAAQLGTITSSENLVLGLLGGLRSVTGSTPPIQYNKDWVGKGAGALGISPKKHNPYGDTSDLSAGDYVDNNGTTGFDSIIPEYVDRFPDAMPVLYLRARAGIRPNMSTAAANPVATDGSRVGQYDTTQVYGYVFGDAGTAIGVGKGLSANDYVTVPAGQHGMQSAYMAYGSSVDPNSAGYTYPLNLYSVARHSTLDTATTPTPKQKDRYILISAGADRVYGTKDDLTNFGAY